MIKNIKATGIELSPAISAYIEEKLTYLNKYIAPDDTSAQVEVEVGKTTKHHKTGNFFRAEFNFSLRGEEYYAVAEEADLYAAIDVAKDVLVREITRARGRTRALWRRGGQIIKKLLRSS